MSIEIPPQNTEEVAAIDLRHAPLPRPDNLIEIKQWREAIKNAFPECLPAAEVGLAVMSQLIINDIHNPFGLVYVDVPSAGKTITLNFFSGIEELVYGTDSFTPSSLVSHATNRKREDLEKIDLLPRIRYKTVLVRDLAPLFAERQEHLLKTLGVLTRVFDGEGYVSNSGVHGDRGYRGDYVFMFLAASTPIAPRVWRFMGNLGSRLFFLNLNTPDKTEDELADLLIRSDFRTNEHLCRSVTRDMVLSLRTKYPRGIDWEKSADELQYRKIIGRCANLLAHLRGIEKSANGGDEGESDQVVIEKPTRINQLLYNLARGHALACGRNRLAAEDMWPVIEVTLNSGPPHRVKLIERLIAASGGHIDTAQVQSVLDRSAPMAIQEMHSLASLGIVTLHQENGKIGRPKKYMVFREPFNWFASQECRELRSMKP